MGHPILYQNNTILLPTEDPKRSIAINPERLGWDFEKNIRLQTMVPSFAAPKLPLLMDLLLLSDDGEALAIILCDLPLENEKELRLVADYYSNSVKRVYGRRPIVVFWTEGKCKVANGLLGAFDLNCKPLPKPAFLEFSAIHNIQEAVLFPYLLQDPDRVKAFLTGQLNTEETNQVLMAAIEEAKQTGSFQKHYETVTCPTEEQKKSLLKQAVLLAGLGDARYGKLLADQTALVQRAFQNRCKSVLSYGFRRKQPLGVAKDTPESRLLQWAWQFLGWDLATEVKEKFSIPCYDQEGMTFPIDFALLDLNGVPVLFFLQDNLSLTKDKLFVIAEYYARSGKKAYGLTPMVLIASGGHLFLKSGALSGGFEEATTLMAKPFLVAQTHITNVTETNAWNALLEHLAELKAIPTDAERTKRQLELVRLSANETRTKLSDVDFVSQQVKLVMESKELSEEVFWQQVLGSTRYETIRTEERKLLRTFAADKRLELGLLN